MKLLFTTLLHFPPSNSSILKVFPQSFPIEIKPSYCPAKEKKGQEKRKKRGGEKAKLCLLQLPHIQKLLFTVRNKRQRSARPINEVYGSFGSFQPNSDQKTARLVCTGELPSVQAKPEIN